MAGIWFKRCPQCRDYMQKSDPGESAICCSCGWKEYVAFTFYCGVADKHCTYLCPENEQQVSTTRSSRERNGRS
jgi:hypothetical protein